MRGAGLGFRSARVLPALDGKGDVENTLGQVSCGGPHALACLGHVESLAQPQPLQRSSYLRTCARTEPQGGAAYRGLVRCVMLNTERASVQDAERGDTKREELCAGLVWHRAQRTEDWTVLKICAL